MKKIFCIVFIITISYSLYWIISREKVEVVRDDIVLKKEVIIIKPIPIQESKLRISTKRKKIVSRLKIKKVHPAEKTIIKLQEEKIIQAEIIDGKAIAYGDVVIGLVDENEIGKAKFVNLEAPTIKLWDTNKIFYQIEDNLKNKATVERAIKILNQTTVLEFKKFTSEDQDGIFFKAGKENCYSLLGKLGGAQPIWLAPDCGVTEVLHEVLHALGFIHEQSRADRDIYLTINWDNILPKFYSQYQMVPDDYMVTVEGTEFDFRSIMLYRPTFFAKDKKVPTMIPHNNELINPMRERLSPVDIERIYRIYGQ